MSLRVGTRPECNSFGKRVLQSWMGRSPFDFINAQKWRSLFIPVSNMLRSVLSILLFVFLPSPFLFLFFFSVISILFTSLFSYPPLLSFLLDSFLLLPCVLHCSILCLFLPFSLRRTTQNLEKMVYRFIFPFHFPATLGPSQLYNADSLCSLIRPLSPPFRPPHVHRSFSQGAESP